MFAAPEEYSTMWMAVAALVNGIIVTLVMAVVSLWIITQLQLWRTHQSRRRERPDRSDRVKPAVWP